MRNDLFKDLKRQYIVDCTKKLIEKKGINNINMESIAKESSYTKRTLYSYFNSKDEIFLWVFTDDLNERWNFQKERLAVKSEGFEKLREWAESLFDYCSLNKISLQLQNYMDYYFVDLKKVNEEVFQKFEKINNELAEGLRRIFEEAFLQGELKENVNIDVAISQFLYSYRAILKRVFSDQYSFAKIDKNEYVQYYIESYIISQMKQ